MSSETDRPRDAERIPSLDGLRAFSVSLVVIGHAANMLNLPRTPLRVIAGNGGLGVEIFFVISGFLITTLLLREFSKTGTLGLRGFYWRRAFRILPPYYAYILTVALLGAVGYVTVPPGAMISSTAFLWNYWPIEDGWYFEHFWSLAVEEQFYLIWPAVLLTALRAGSHRGALAFCLAVVALAPAIRVATHLWAPEMFQGRIYFMAHTRADALMFGAICALCVGREWFERILREARPLFPFLAACFVFIASPLLTKWLGGAYLYVAGYTLEGALIAFVLMWLVRHPRSVAGRILNSPIPTQIGVMSYSIYIWQMLFLDQHARWFGDLLWPAFVAIAGCSAASYYLIEQPALRLRSRIRFR